VGLAGVLGGRDSDNLGEGHRWGVDAGHAQSVVVCQILSSSYSGIEALNVAFLLYAPPQDGGVELALRAAVQEFVQLVQNLAVWVGAVRRLTFVRLAENGHSAHGITLRWPDLTWCALRSICY
jgi:hypothetical protein